MFLCEESEMYDAIVVGARVAGAPTAMLLARKGHRVLLVDRDTFPSDIMSTHYIHPEGVKRLHNWGIFERAVAGCPPIRELVFDFGPGMAATVPVQPYEDVAEARCPRRITLDAALVEAAVEAGVEVRQGFSVRGLLKEGGRVTGISGRSADGIDASETARIVVGADGMHSFVARQVQADEYNTVPALGCAYYTYWSGTDLNLGPVEFYFREKKAVLLFPTNDGQACVGIYWPRDWFDEIRKDAEGSYWRVLEELPALAARMRTAKQEQRFIGTGDLRNFYRRPFGPGWALAGDAGYHKDPILGWGISDAFRDADLLSDALDAGLSGRAPLDDALAGYEQQRNAATAETYQQTLWFASLPPPIEIAQAMRRNVQPPATSTASAAS
jgi:flavin-dependent dehydrogenase